MDPSAEGGELIIVDGRVIDAAMVVIEGNTVYKLQIDTQPQTVLEGADDISPWLWATRIGDPVRVEYYAIVDAEGNPDVMQPMHRFRNLRILPDDRAAAATPTPTLMPTPTATPSPTPAAGLDNN